MFEICVSTSCSFNFVEIRMYLCRLNWVLLENCIEQLNLKFEAADRQVVNCLPDVCENA